MGQVLHGCATTTEAIRRAIQNSQESLRALSRRYRINPKTVAKWKKRGSAVDQKTGPKEPKSTSLSVEDEAIIVVFRKHTLLPLDDLQAIRSIALGRKNHLFASSDTGGERAATVYTIVQTAKLNGVNPEAYLRDTLASIAEGHPINRIGELMPWNLPVSMQ
jgi:hypothetical protein